jgi:rubrerythrin
MNFKKLSQRLAQRHYHPDLNDPAAGDFYDDGTEECPECSSTMVNNGDNHECPTCGHIERPRERDYEPEVPDYDSPQVKNMEFGGRNYP